MYCLHRWNYNQVDKDKLDFGIERNKLIDLVIPVRNKERWRILRCVNSIKKNNLDLVNRIIVVDCGSDKPIKPIKGVEILRLELDYFNKGWALNHAFKLCNARFIGHVDVDMLMAEQHFRYIFTNLDLKNIIIDTNVRRIEIKHLSDNYNDMIEHSLPWYQGGISQLHNLANGGIQIYPKKFWENIKGIPEGLCVTWSAEDNFLIYQGRILGYNIVDMSYPLLHMFHKPRVNTEYHIDKKIVNEYINYKSKWLNEMIKQNINHNPESFIARNKPCTELYDKFLKDLKERDKIIKQAVELGETEVEWMFETYKLQKERPQVLISVINNYDTIPTFFMVELIKLYEYSKKTLDIDLHFPNACSVAMMRNEAVRWSLGNNPHNKKYEYLVELDSDHKYPMDFLIKFIDMMEKNKLMVLTGLTSSQRTPFYNTQYYKIIPNINRKSNCVSSEIKDKIINIEASGPVGMVMNTKIFEKLSFPYYFERYDLPEKINPTYYPVSEDIWFCERLKEENIKLYCYLGTSFPHARIGFLNRETFQW